MQNYFWAIILISLFSCAGFVLFKEHKRKIKEKEMAEKKRIRRKKKEEKKALQKKLDESSPSKVIISSKNHSKVQRGRQSVVLLVEDSPTMMLTLRKILERWNYRVISASDGRKAWHELQKSKPDIIISDIDMPELNGIELLKLIRSDLLLMDIPVILITGSPSFHLQATQEAGVDGLLAKPFEDSALITQVKYLLQE